MFDSDRPDLPQDHRNRRDAKPPDARGPCPADPAHTRLPRSGVSPRRTQDAPERRPPHPRCQPHLRPLPRPRRISRPWRVSSNCLRVPAALPWDGFTISPLICLSVYGWRAMRINTGLHAGCRYLFCCLFSCWDHWGWFCICFCASRGTTRLQTPLYPNKTAELKIGE